MGLIASEELCAALRAYQQADMDGVMVLVSREVCEKAAIELEAMRSVLAALRAFVQLDDDGAITLAPDQAGSYDTDFVLALSNSRDLLSRQGIASVPPSARLPVLSAKEVEDIALATFAKMLTHRRKRCCSRLSRRRKRTASLSC